MVKTEKKLAPKKYELVFQIVAPNPEKGDKEVTHLSVEVYYNKDRVNYFQGVSKARGIYCSVGPMHLETKMLDGHPYTIRSFGMMSAPTYLLVAEERLNRKHVEEQFEQVRCHLRTKTGRPWETVLKVLEQNKLMLTEEERKKVLGIS